MTIGERIKQVRKEEQLNLDNFGAKIGVSGPAISMMEHGKSSVTDRTISSICREFHISEEWLRTGRGRPKEEQERDAALESGLNEILTAGPDDFRKKLISILVRLPPEKWEVLAEIADELAQDTGEHAVPAAQVDKYQNQEMMEAAQEISMAGYYQEMEKAFAMEKNTQGASTSLQNESGGMTGTG